jgi:hypothetical protein
MLADWPPDDNWKELEESDRVAFVDPFELAIELLVMLCCCDDEVAVSLDTTVLELDEDVVVELVPVLLLHPPRLGADP